MSSKNDNPNPEEPLSSEQPVPCEAISDWISSLGGALMTSVYEIDMMLADAREILLLSQPSMSGRFDIKWWRSRNGVGREPFLLEWIEQDGRWSSKKIAGRSLHKLAKRSGPFTVGAAQTRVALSQIEKLMTARRELLAIAGNSRQTLNNKMNGVRTSLAKVMATLEEQKPLAEISKEIRTQKYLDKL